jgi:hypothetical protein
MNAVTEQLQRATGAPSTELAIGQPYAGGFYGGPIRIDGALFAIIVAPKAAGERTGAWDDSDKDVAGATSYADGLQNTIAMGEAGSDLAQWARGLRIADCDDWFIPSQDELEVIYRNLKPTADTNTQYGRSGLNASAVTPTYPYSRAEPTQTQAEVFRAGGAEAFDDVWYWSSTQHAAYSDCAWGQDFGDGGQDFIHKSYEGRARAVRRLPI